MTADVAPEVAGAPVFTPAPPEVTGPGSLRPTLVVGLGQAGLRVLQRLRFDLTERYGPPDYTPAVRTLFIDTDPDALDDAARPRPVERLAGLGPDEVAAARLNRAGHYLKPRLNGRSLIEGWFDPQLFLDMIEQHRLQQSAVVPTMLQILLSQPLEDYELSSLQYVSSGGAPLAAEVAEQFSRRVPSARKVRTGRWQASKTLRI